MSRPFLRVDLSGDDADFRSVAVEPGLPLLDRSNSVGTLLKNWLGRFAAEVVWQNDTVQFFVHDDEGCRFADMEPHLVSRSELQRGLKREYDELRTRLTSAKAHSLSAQAIHRFMCAELLAPQPAHGFAHLNGQFFKYRDVQGQWRLIWCYGFEPTIQGKPLRPVICGDPECRQLALTDGKPQGKCHRCDRLFQYRAARPRYGKWIALFLLLTLVGAAGFFYYPRSRAVLSGRVVRAADGRPVTAAEVRATGLPAMITDSNGEFRIEHLPGGTLTVEVSASGYRVESFETELVPGTESPIDIRLSRTSQLPGRVVYLIGAQDLPISRARVSVGSKAVAAAESDQTGAFVLMGLPPGPIKVDVSADGFFPAQLDATVSSEPGPPLRVVLSGNGQIAGRVVYAGDESVPIAGRKLVWTGLSRPRLSRTRVGSLYCRVFRPACFKFPRWPRRFKPILSGQTLVRAPCGFRWQVMPS